MITGLMNQFFAPMKAVVLRLVELKIFPDELARVLFGFKDLPMEVFTKQIYKLCVEYGYTNLLEPTNKRYIEGLAQKLNMAEQQSLVSPNKIRIMREKFGLDKATPDGIDLNNMISLDTQEGQDE